MQMQVKGVFLFITAALVLQTSYVLYKYAYLPNQKVESTAQTTVQVQADQQTKPELPASNFCAWVPQWDQDRAIASTQAAANDLNTISPVWYQLSTEGEIEAIKNVKKAGIIETVNSESISLIPTVFNQFDPKRTDLLLKSEEQQDLVIDQLVEIAKTENLDGFDIDFEEMSPGSRDAFSSFIEKMSKTFKSNGLMLTVSVPARTGQNDRMAAQQYDLSKIASAANYVRVMAYDFHNTNTKPGPVTPPDRLAATIQFMSQEIPQDKLIVGLPLYGYDWDSSHGTSGEYQNLQTTLATFKASSTRDEATKSLTATYNNNGSRTMWFEDAESTLHKIQIARDNGAYQFCFWRLGGEDPALWEKLSQ